MYKGFQVELNQNFTPFRRRSFDTYVTEGRRRMRSQSNDIKDVLSDFIRNNGDIDGKLLSESWFQAINSHVFLSHSHADEDLAIAFSQWLYEAFGLRVFIDSMVWGYADNLLKEIDDKWCLTDDKRHYRYSLRNRTTAFVHILLASALTQMMDKSESLIFLNTPNSIIPDPNSQETHSPWIYYELNQSVSIRKELARTRLFNQGGKVVLNESFSVALPATTSHLTNLTAKMLLEWKNVVDTNGYTKRPLASLDILYQLINNTKNGNR